MSSHLSSSSSGVGSLGWSGEAYFRKETRVITKYIIDIDKKIQNIFVKFTMILNGYKQIIKHLQVQFFSFFWLSSFAQQNWNCLWSFFPAFLETDEWFPLNLSKMTCRAMKVFITRKNNLNESAALTCMHHSMLADAFTPTVQYTCTRIITFTLQEYLVQFNTLPSTYMYTKKSLLIFKVSLRKYLNLSRKFNNQIHLP